MAMKKGARDGLKRCVHCDARLRFDGKWYVWKCPNGCEDCDPCG